MRGGWSTGFDKVKELGVRNWASRALWEMKVLQPDQGRVGGGFVLIVWV